jgi:hypothetical protein
VLSKQQMCGTADREKLGQTLDDAQDDEIEHGCAPAFGTSKCCVVSPSRALWVLTPVMVRLFAERV